MKQFNQNREALNRELEKFVSTLNELLPRYSLLLRKQTVSDEELEELGEIEHFLIEVNSKISEIKERLEQDLYGHTIDTYYKLKGKAAKGDEHAKRKLDRIRLAFEDYLQKGTFINWN